MAAINDVSERSEAGVDPKLLIESLMSELAKAATRATKLEVDFMEKSRELDTIRDSLTKSEERAKTDTLTGLPNRRALEEFFRKAQLAAMEQGEAVSALLIDIDHFKRFNDEYGHGVGDQVLRLMAKVLREQVREIDLPARYGGEELIVSCPRGSRDLRGHRRTHPALDCGMPDEPPFDRRSAARYHGLDRGGAIPGRRIHGRPDRPLRPGALSGQEDGAQSGRHRDRTRAGEGGLERFQAKWIPVRIAIKFTQIAQTYLR
jgi:diguanylate cyclase (GGDEF) domain